MATQSMRDTFSVDIDEWPNALAKNDAGFALTLLPCTLQNGFSF